MRLSAQNDGSKRPVSARRLRWLAALGFLIGVLAFAFAAAKRSVKGTRVHLVGTRWIAASPEKVFAVVADPRKGFLTDNPITSMEIVGDRTEGVGTVYRWKFHLPFGLRFTFDEVVTAWEPNRRLAYRATTGWEMTAESRLKAEGEGTRVTFTLDCRLPGSRGLIPRWMISLGISLALAGIARRAEGTEHGWFRVLAWQGVIVAPPERVFVVVANPESKYRWVAGIRRVVPHYEGAPHLGARYLASSGWGPFEFAYQEEITAWEPGRRVAYTGTSPFGTFRAEHLLTPTGAGTRLDYHMDYRFPWAPLSKLVGPLLRLAQARVGDPSMRRLKELCEINRENGVVHKDRDESYSRKDEYIPALRYRWLTPLYDFAQRWIFRESIFKAEMVRQAHIEKGHRVLDLGCGTATLTILVKKLHPEAEVVGLDGDPEVLETARSKAVKAGVDITFDQGMAFQLPYPDSSFDRVLSSLMFHHLNRENKYKAMREVLRVLQPGGEFHLADLGKQHGLTYLIGLILARLEEGVDNVRGLLPQMLREVGFEQVKEAARFTMPYGTVSLYRGRKPR